ncbi:MAG: hypothetical protein IJL70_05925 [Treponema sp.]|nr:hypothetical protein [Treponema sp.]
MKKNLVLLFLICIFSLNAAAKTFVEMKDKVSADFVTACFYELLRSEACCTKNQFFQESDVFKPSYFLQKALDFYSLTHWSFAHGAENLLDHMFPMYHSLLETSLSYDPYADDGNWIAQLVTGAESDFMITRPSELEEAEKELKEFSDLSDGKTISDYDNENFSDYDEEEQKIPVVLTAPEPNVKEYAVRSKESRLVTYSYEDEFLNIQYGDTQRIIVRGDSKNLVRFFYDEKMRMNRKETWLYTGAVSSSELINSQVFRYGDNSSVPMASMVLGKDYRQELKYDQNGRVVQRADYIKEKENEYLNVRTSWIFAEDGRILEKKYETFIYKEGKKRRLQNIESKKEKYEYKVDDSTPDYYYYENDELRMKTEYTTSSDYVTTTLFDGGFVIETYYENYTKKKEVFLLNGKVKRIKKYEL